MGGNNSKTPEASKIEDANFDLPGCLESLSDMAQTGKCNTSFRKASTTSRALWSMSRTLSAPVATNDYLSKRPSLERTKAVSLDTYSPRVDHMDVVLEENRRSSGGIALAKRTLSHKGIFSSCMSSTDAEDSDDTFPQEAHMIPGSSYTSPAIEVSPPDTEASHLLQDKDRLRRASGAKKTGGTDTGKVSPRDTTYRLKVPTKHSLLQEKRKKFLKKSSPVEEEHVEESRLQKEHSQDKAPDWEHIQEWMVWCIHENLDSSDDDDSSDFPGCSSPASVTHRSISPHRSPFSKLAQLQQRHSVEERYLLSHRHHQGDSQSPPRASPAILQRNRSIPARMTPSLSPLHRSVVDIGQGQAERPNQRRKGTLSLDEQKTVQQSSFESSGSSRMNSFDSTGTHNEHL